MGKRRGWVVAIAGAKGGTSKSTVAIGLAVEALDRGHRVLLVDLDSRQRTATNLTASLEAPRPSVQGLDHRLLRDQIPAEQERFDLILIDCPGRADGALVAAVAVADLVLLPTSGSASDLDAFGLSFDLAVETSERLNALGGNPPLVRALPSRVNPRTVIGRELRETLKQAGAPAMHTTIPDAVAFAEHPAVSRYASGSLAARAVVKLADEVLDLLEVPVPRVANG